MPCFIDDVVKELVTQIDKLLNKPMATEATYFEVFPVYKKQLGYVCNCLVNYKNSQHNLKTFERAEGFERAIAATFLSFCPEEKISYPIVEHKDDRGSFYEVFKLGAHGQVSVSTTKPGITRGNHFHYSKQEKFLVVKG